MTLLPSRLKVGHTGHRFEEASEVGGPVDGSIIRGRSWRPIETAASEIVDAFHVEYFSSGISATQSSVEDARAPSARSRVQPGSASPIGGLVAPRKKRRPPAPLATTRPDHYREPVQLEFDF